MDGRGQRRDTDNRSGRCYRGLLLRLRLGPQQINLNKSDNALIVTGIGEASVTPDRVKMLFAIIKEAETAEEASATNADRHPALITRLTNAGISGSQVETSWYGISPTYEYPQYRRPILTGYRAEHQISVTVISGDTGQLGKNA